METSNTLIRRGILPKGKTRNKSDKSNDYRKSHEDAEKDSIWLFDVLEVIGFNEEYRKTCQQTAITVEILHSFQGTNTVFCFGSDCEGTASPDHENDIDTIECEKIPIIENITKTDKDDISLLIIKESDTRAGYVKLQIVRGSVPCTAIHLPLLYDTFTNDCLQTDQMGRVLLSNLPAEHLVNVFSRYKNKPATKSKYPIGFNLDFVKSYRCSCGPYLLKSGFLDKDCMDGRQKIRFKSLNHMDTFWLKKVTLIHQKQI